MTTLPCRTSRAAATLVVFLASFAVAAAPTSRPAWWFTPEQFDFKAIMGDPPADDSRAHKQEVERMLQLQANRTADEERRCKGEEEVTAFAFAEELGPWFNAKDLPATAELMHDVYVDAKVVSAAAKKSWGRPRPPAADPRIHPCVAMEDTASFPSGHAVRGVVWAILLAEMFPDHREALMAHGRRIGDDRFLAGMHYPTDVEAGQKLGAAIAKHLLADPAFKAALDRARDECLADVKAH